MIKPSRGERIFRVCNTAILCIIALMCLLPLLNVLALSFSSATAASTGSVTLWPKDVTLVAFRTILKKQEFLGTFWTSTKRVLIGVPVNMMLTIMAAYPLCHDKLTFRQGYVAIVVFTMLFSGGLIPMYLVVKSLGLLNSFWSLILPFAVPVYNVILMVNFFKNVPIELEEAAIIDGASYFRTLIQTYVPCSLPSIATLTLFCVVNHWNEWFYGAIFLNRLEDMPLQTYLQQLLNLTKAASMQNLSQKEMEEMSKINSRTFNAAQIVISSLPVLAIYPFLQKYFVTGLTLGSVKG